MATMETPDLSLPRTPTAALVSRIRRNTSSSGAPADSLAGSAAVERRSNPMRCNRKSSWRQPFCRRHGAYAIANPALPSRSCVPGPSRGPESGPGTLDRRPRTRDSGPAISDQGLLELAAAPRAPWWLADVSPGFVAPEGAIGHDRAEISWSGRGSAVA